MRENGSAEYEIVDPWQRPERLAGSGQRMIALAGRVRRKVDRHFNHAFDGLRSDADEERAGKRDGQQERSRRGHRPEPAGAGIVGVALRIPYGSLACQVEYSSAVQAGWFRLERGQGRLHRCECFA